MLDDFTDFAAAMYCRQGPQRSQPDSYFAGLLQQGPHTSAQNQRIFEAWGEAIAWRKVWGLAA